jgi:hypothetical protein
MQVLLQDIRYGSYKYLAPTEQVIGSAKTKPRETTFVAFVSFCKKSPSLCLFRLRRAYGATS